MIKHFCDRCGKEQTSATLWWARLGWFGGAPERDLELCHVCMVGLRKFVKVPVSGGTIRPLVDQQRRPG